MKSYFGNIIVIAIACLVGGYLAYNGLKSNATIKYIIGFLIVISFVPYNYDRIEFKKELNRWMKSNNGKLVLFYPTNKKLQSKIEDAVLSLVPQDTLRVFYDGPNLVGDIKPSIIIEIMNQNEIIFVNEPCVFKFYNNKLHVEPLIENEDFEFSLENIEALRLKIEKVKNA